MPSKDRKTDGKIGGKAVGRDSVTGKIYIKGDQAFPANRTLKQGEKPKS
jgi:hypothetical protein